MASTMYLRILDDQELAQYAERISKWTSDAERAEIAGELERRRLGLDKTLATIQAIESQWRENGCAKDSFGHWTAPYELIWRSLPHGEDR